MTPPALNDYLPEHSFSEIITEVESIVETKIGSFLWKIVAGFVVGAIAFAIAWGTLQQRVAANEETLNDLKDTTPAYLTREQVQDLLGARDQRLSNIEEATKRIEGKLDQLTK
jgi:hypothetical protein